MLRHCCNCKKEALIFPYICVDCLDLIQTTNKRIETLKGIIETAYNVLKKEGFTEECKSILYMTDLAIKEELCIK